MLFMVMNSGGLARRRVNKYRKSEGNWKDTRKERTFKTKDGRKDQKGQTEEKKT